jgi:bilirubin oxidase
MVTRRQFLKGGAVGTTALLVPWAAAGPAPAAVKGGSLDPGSIPKYATPLVIPPVMPALTGAAKGSIDRYAIAVRQFRQQILPPGSRPPRSGAMGRPRTATPFTRQASRSRRGSTGRSG